MALNLATERYAAINVTMPWRASLPYTNLVGLGAAFAWQRQMVAYLSRTPDAAAPTTTRATRCLLGVGL